MKRVLLAVAIILVAGAAVYAQTSAEVRQNAQTQLNQGRTNSTQFEQSLADLAARNAGNSDSAAFNQLRSEIERLESSIATEQNRIRSALDNGSRVNPEMFNRVQRLMDRHSAKLAELEAFIARQ
ncbi:MAG: aminoglycoside 6-adenylyltransferase [Treponema sp.]|nr:aminoglycoside 6-adenylyltransferase [Treponema sp.]